MFELEDRARTRESQGADQREADYTAPLPVRASWITNRPYTPLLVRASWISTLSARLVWMEGADYLPSSEMVSERFRRRPPVIGLSQRKTPVASSHSETS
jgi:hypothetical protein